MKIPLFDTAAVNATKYRLLTELQKLGYPVETGSGAQTSFNRTAQGLEKAHWVDAACVGDSGAVIMVPPPKPLRIKCMGRGNRQMCKTNRYGFPIALRQRQKVRFGFQTGDMVRAVVTEGKYLGTHVGRITIRAKPSFRLGTLDVSVPSLTRLQRCDGYSYEI